jgi:hypothetical protein
METATNARRDRTGYTSCRPESVGKSFCLQSPTGAYLRFVITGKKMYNECAPATKVQVGSYYVASDTARETWRKCLSEGWVRID